MKHTTKRDAVWSTIYTSDRSVWTVQDMQAELDLEVSRKTVNNVFLSACEQGIMKHKKHSAVWKLKK
jgi:hypothetical protein